MKFCQPLDLRKIQWKLTKNKFSLLIINVISERGREMCESLCDYSSEQVMAIIKKLSAA